MNCRHVLSALLASVAALALPQTATAQITLPPGYTSVQYFSYGDSGAFLTNGALIGFGNGGLFGNDLFLTDNTRNGGNGRLIRVSDTNGNGQIDAGEPVVVVFQGPTSGMRFPVGLAFGKNIANAFDNDLFFADDYDGSANTIYRVSDNGGASLSLGTFVPVFTFFTPTNPVFKNDGTVLYLSDMSNFTAFGGGTDGLIYRILPTGARNTFRSGFWDVNNADVTPDGWLVVLNANFPGAGGACCLGTGQIIALRDNNADGDAQDANELKILVDQNSGFGRFPAFAYGPDGAAYVGVAAVAPAGSPAATMTQVHRLADLNGDGDYWNAGANTFDAGEKTLWASGVPGSPTAIRFNAAGHMFVGTLGSLSGAFTSRITRIFPLPSTDVEIEKTASTPSPVVGQPFTYTLTVTNHGPASASDTVALDTLPAGLTFGSAIASQGSCSGTSSLNCALGTLAASGVATVTIAVTPTAAGSITNTATVSSANLDTDSANNSASVVVDVLGDADGDGVGDANDNCPNQANANQVDIDGDDLGDACDPDNNDGPLGDLDGDGIINDLDPDDNDGPVGDLDGDGVLNGIDNCATTANAAQLNFDGDPLGDACDPDDDNDSVPDTTDAFPLDASESVDTDHDGAGNNTDPDDDNDGVVDAHDAFPLDSSESVDTDQDGIGNNADPDDDNDGVADAADAFPLNPSESVDTDHDGVGNNSDPDDDNDGVADAVEVGAGSDPLNAASTPEVCDGIDNDLDGASDDGLPNNDGDAAGDACDPDDDNDGVPDASDAFPFNGSESIDTDHDGIGNNADADDDGDGDADATDCAPLNAAVGHSASEIAGNSIDDNCNGQVDESSASLVFGGLQAPYAAPPSSFKIGRTIPLKWQYTDAAGVVVDSAAATPTVYYGAVACGASSGGATLDIDSPGSSGLNYDAATRIWQLNWKTTGIPSGCYAIVITSPIAQSSTMIPLQLK